MKHPNKSFPTRLGLYTQKIVKPLFKARGLMEGKIITHWPHIVGEKFACFSIPEKITFPKGKREEGTLHLSVTSSGSLFIQSAQDLILERINTFFGYKALIKLYMTHDFIPPKKLPPKPLPSLSSEEMEWIKNKTQIIHDSELKTCLEELGISLLSI